MKNVETMTKSETLNSKRGRILVHLLKSKIHRAYVTAASLDYEGSMTIDSDFMEKVGLLPYEKILCSNLANGARF